jgi:GNAT superfamily N-acetyltransferase
MALREPHQKASDILLVNPPVVSPAMAPLTSSCVAGCLTRSGLTFQHYDANLDFFLNHLLTPKFLYQALTRITEETPQPIKPYGVSSEIKADISSNPEQWRKKISTVGACLTRLRSHDFYQPEKALRALKHIKDMIRLVSTAYHPACINWNGFFFKPMGSLPGTDEFFENDKINPFLVFSQNRLISRLTPSVFSRMILVVGSPGQQLPALTLARTVKIERTDVETILVGDDAIFGHQTDFIDRQFSHKGYNALVDHIGGPGTAVLLDDAGSPDFSGLPLNDYLAPDIVLPFQLSGEHPQSQASAAWLSFLIEQQHRYGVKSFFSYDDRITPEYVNVSHRTPAEPESHCHIGLTCPLTDAVGSDTIDSVFKRGVRLINWRQAENALSIMTQMLFKAAKAGIWNHLEIPGDTEEGKPSELLRFAAANPDIAHSYSHEGLALNTSEDIDPDVKRGPLAYSQVAELPGAPFWRSLEDPVFLLLYLSRYDSGRLKRWRTHTEAGTVYSLGKRLEYHFASSGELPAGYLDEICRMVEAGGSVDTRWVRYNLERAFLIGYVVEQGIIVGNSSLKRPRPEYIDTVKKEYGLDLSHHLERGYTSVRPEYRGLGIGTKLLAGLTARAGKRKIFSIISEDNLATKKIALRNRTRQVASFYSTKTGKQMGIWMPEEMIED